MCVPFLCLIFCSAAPFLSTARRLFGLAPAAVCACVRVGLGTLWLAALSPFFLARHVQLSGFFPLNRKATSFRFFLLPTLPLSKHTSPRDCAPPVDGRRPARVLPVREHTHVFLAPLPPKTSPRRLCAFADGVHKWAFVLPSGVAFFRCVVSPERILLPL